MTHTPRPTPVTVVVTGAAGQIGYAALFRIAAGAIMDAERVPEWLG